MKYKTRKDVERVVNIGKPSAVIEKFIQSYLEGLAVAPIIQAEARYAVLLVRPDRPDVAAEIEERRTLVAEAVYEPVEGSDEFTVVSDAVYELETVTISAAYSPNSIRDAEISALVMQYPHLIEPKPVLEPYTGFDNDGNEVELSRELPVPSVAERRPELVLSVDLARPLYKQMIAAQRYAHEVGGVELDGHVLATDRESVSMLDSYMDKLRREVIPTVSWKCANGDHFTIDATNMTAVEAGVLGHVAAAFAIEEHWCGMIDAAQSVADFPTSEQVLF